MNFKDLLRKIKPLYKIVLFERIIQYYVVPNIYFKIGRYCRRHHIITNKYVERIKLYENKHQGDRCFIIATGPSLTCEDLEKLRGEITFGMNSISKIGEKTNWRPTYYAIQDKFVYKKLKDSINLLDKSIIIFISSLFAIKDKIYGENIVQMPIYCQNHLIEPFADNIMFSDDCYDLIYDGYTITYSIIQLAVYMGFKEIYLLGTDCSYTQNGSQHFIETGIVDPNAKFAGERMIRSYKKAKEYADKHNIKIYNATRGGYLEVFNRVSMDGINFKSF